jgi:hypothetical protein
MPNIKPLDRDALSHVTGGMIKSPEWPQPPKPWPQLPQPTKPWTPPTLA